MALFGVSYAVASIGCSLPLFLAYMASNFGRGTVAGVVSLAAYGTGFALVIAALTTSLAVGRRSVAGNLRRVLPHVNRAAGVLMVAAGIYVVYFGATEIRRNGGASTGTNRVQERVGGWSADVTAWVTRTGGGTVAIGLAGVVLIVALLTAVQRRRNRAATLGPATDGRCNCP
jgi:hypothetical protein